MSKRLTPSACRENWLNAQADAIRIYDMQTDHYRVATQGDVDVLQRKSEAFRNYAQAIDKARSDFEANMARIVEKSK
jgi:hypothetical protein